MSQWSPGMSMVGDMFNTKLKAKLDALCSDIAAHLDASGAAGGARSAEDEVSYCSMPGLADWPASDFESYTDYYNCVRTHRSRVILGGLYHHYARV